LERQGTGRERKTQKRVKGTRRLVKKAGRKRKSTMKKRGEGAFGNERNCIGGEAGLLRRRERGRFPNAKKNQTNSSKGLSKGAR